MKIFLASIPLFWTFVSFSQTENRVDFSELRFSFNKDSTELTVTKKGEPLHGTYKIVTSDDSFTITTFAEGKAEGTVHRYNGEILSSISEMINGLPNGISIAYDKSGKKIMYRLNMSNGKMHGHCWWVDEGDTYFINDKRVSKEEYLEYESRCKGSQN